MKKKCFERKLFLNKKTVINLSINEMRNSRAGGDKTEIGPSCDTGLPCCNTAPPRCKPENFITNNGNHRDKKTKNKHCDIF